MEDTDCVCIPSWTWVNRCLSGVMVYSMDKWVNCMLENDVGTVSGVVVGSCGCMQIIDVCFLPHWLECEWSHERGW